VNKIFPMATAIFSGLWCWLLSKVLINGVVVVCEPITPVLWFEAVGTGIICLVSILWLIKERKRSGTK